MLEIVPCRYLSHLRQYFSNSTIYTSPFRRACISVSLTLAYTMHWAFPPSSVSLLHKRALTHIRQTLWSFPHSLPSVRSLFYSQRTSILIRFIISCHPHLLRTNGLYSRRKNDARNVSPHATGLRAIFSKFSIALWPYREETVRAITAQPLVSISRKVPMHLSKRWLYSSLHDFIMQEVVVVRTAARRTLAHSSDAK